MAKLSALKPCGYTLDVVAANVAEAVDAAGGLIFDRAHGGWTVRVFVLDDDLDHRALRILGARSFRYHWTNPVAPSKRHTALALSSAAMAQHDDIYHDTLTRLHRGCTEVTLWGDPPTELQQHLLPMQHRLTPAATAFKTAAWAACSTRPAAKHHTERFHGSGTLCLPGNPTSPQLPSPPAERTPNQLPSLGHARLFPRKEQQ
ncbi:hypothetical protein C6A86_007180 [Mycobacterium sp. ITM-2016-00316]|uniref:hypothetical protein n=1 Tax=Mycobacterium sp. ITM-2016-00316 TaxID=2099695 RepID=UPI00115BF25B|nr:hypothetical protein [Mycobacterium sp. ITM-2016-00316]WNG83436.1 hypothetical protein C6A86_007180 [Mycobacterium sp. ITM-2016-00316]